MLYQLSYASPSSAPHIAKPLTTTPENAPEPADSADTLALRAVFGTELKVSIGSGAEQTCGRPWKTGLKFEFPAISQPIPALHINPQKSTCNSSQSGSGSHT
jgi:hypothetical protein